MRLIAIEEHILPNAVRDAWSAAAPMHNPVSAVADGGETGARLADLGESRIAMMDEQGVDVQVLSLTTPNLRRLPRAPSCGRMSNACCLSRTAPGQGWRCCLPRIPRCTLVRWATEEGDLLSRVGTIEVGLASLARLPSLATPLVPLVPLVASMLAQDPDDCAGRLALVSGVVTFVGAESEVILSHPLANLASALARMQSSVPRTEGGGFRHWRWHLDEMYVKLNGEMVYLWRAVDHKAILESYVTKTRDKDAALTFMKEGAEAPR